MCRIYNILEKRKMLSRVLLPVFQLFQGLLNMWMSSSYPASSCLWLW